MSVACNVVLPYASASSYSCGKKVRQMKSINILCHIEFSSLRVFLNLSVRFVWYCEAIQFR